MKFEQIAAEGFAALIASINARRDSDVLAGLDIEESAQAQAGTGLVIPQASMAMLGIMTDRPYSPPGLYLVKKNDEDGQLYPSGGYYRPWQMADGETPDWSEPGAPIHWPAHVQDVGDPHWGVYRSVGATDLLWYRANKGGPVAITGVAPRLPLPEGEANTALTQAAEGQILRWEESRRKIEEQKAASEAAANQRQIDFLGRCYALYDEGKGLPWNEACAKARAEFDDGTLLVADILPVTAGVVATP